MKTQDTKLLHLILSYVIHDYCSICKPLLTRPANNTVNKNYDTKLLAILTQNYAYFSNYIVREVLSDPFTEAKVSLSWNSYTAWKVSVFGVLLVRIFPHLDWIRTRKTPNRDIFHAVKLLPSMIYETIYSRMDQVNSWKTAFKKFELIWYV